MTGLLGRRTGFSNSIADAPVFYALVLLGTIGGMALSLLGLDPIHLLVFVAVVNGVAAAPFVIVVMLVATHRPTMGAHVNGRLANVVGWLTAVLMAGAAVALFATGAGM
jgi:Mn2+/Fe2+ NRAMP family transporter